MAALTLHQIGVPCVVFEALREMRPLGVAINLQPNAVRELYDLGITAHDRNRCPQRHTKQTCNTDGRETHGQAEQANLSDARITRKQ